VDQSAFDRIARLLGAAATRRRGLAAAASLLVSGFAAVAGVPEARGRNRHPGLEGPCGDGKRKDNICTRNADCCTNICNLELGKKNVDRKGRCRCMRRGQPCKADRNCCNTLTCNGEVCGEAVVCTVCASGCPYTTVLAAIAGEPDGAVITIEPGTYPGDYPIVKTVTLVRCGDAGEVILTNQSAVSGLLPWEQGRVLWMGTYPESAPAETRQPRPAGIVVTLDSISVVGNSAFPLGGGIWVGVTPGQLAYEVRTPAIQARAWLARNAPGDADRAVAALTLVVDHGRASTIRYHYGRVLPLLAAAHALAGDPTAALAVMEEALSLEPGHAIRRFADAGSTALDLLGVIARNPRREMAPRAAAVLAALGGDAVSAALAPAPPLPSALSSRETHILGLMAEAKTNKEIAAELGISAITVREHTVHIFRKLGVGDRRTAVDAARAAGWLPAR
jgi:DNA-binding CsgD family transcriptional regulator